MNFKNNKFLNKFMEAARSGFKWAKMRLRTLSYMLAYRRSSLPANGVPMGSDHTQARIMLIIL